MRSYLAVLLTLASIAGYGYSARLKSSPTWEQLKDSPWVSHRDSTHVRGEGRRAVFTGIEFDMSRDIDHDEKEYRVFYGDVVGMETTMKFSGETGLFHREVTDGKKLIKLVYAGNTGLVDCEVDKDRDALDNFLARFLLMDVNTVRRLRREHTPIDVSILVGNTGLLAGNVSYRLLENRVPHEPYASLADIQTLQEQCIQLHHSIRQNLRTRGVEVDLFQMMSDNDHEPKQEPTVRNEELEMIPRRVKRVKKSAPLGESRSRKRRGLLVPDTMWCGVGSSAMNHDELGPHSRGTDGCCREHDSCPYFIEGFSTNYNYFNFYFHTVSHCYCDEEFRTCLRTVGNSQAEMVGEVFFDVLGMKCFEFETQQVCAERSFWGSCERYEDQVVAKIRGSLDWD